MSAALTHQLVTEYFNKKLKTRAYFAFSVSKQLGDSIRFMTPVLISVTGWRVAWMIGGGISALVGLLIVFTIEEPVNKNSILISNEKVKNKDVKEQANKVLESTKNEDFEVKEVGEMVVLKKKKKTISDLMKDYRVHFGLLFSDMAAMMVVIGCFFRLWQSMTISRFLGQYMKVYKENYRTYSEQAAIVSFAGGPFSTFLSGCLIDYFGPKSYLTIPLICVSKALLSIPVSMMIFYQ
jgi:sugar phosphate permease